MTLIHQSLELLDRLLRNDPHYYLRHRFLWAKQSERWEWWRRGGYCELVKQKKSVPFWIFSFSFLTLFFTRKDLLGKDKNSNTLHTPRSTPKRTREVDIQQRRAYEAKPHSTLDTRHSPLILQIPQNLHFSLFNFLPCFSSCVLFVVLLGFSLNQLLNCNCGRNNVPRPYHQLDISSITISLKLKFKKFKRQACNEKFYVFFIICWNPC